MIVNVYTNNNGVVPVTCDTWDCGKAISGVNRVSFLKHNDDEPKVVAWFALSNINGFKVMSEVSE